MSCWEAINDRAGEAERARRVIEGRDAHVTTGTDGVTYVSGQLPFVAGAEFKAEFDRLEQQLFKADWAHARQRLGDAATANDLVRTPAQRRADALREMARRSATTEPATTEPATTEPGAPAPAARTVVNLVMDWATFCAQLALHEGHDPSDIAWPPEGTSELEDQTPIPPSLGLDAALGGEVRRIVMGAHGEILDFGRKKRLFTGALREAIILRDRICQFPGCEVPARKCEGDHITPWSEGGTTSEANGQIRCDYHNRWKSGVGKKRGPPG